MRYCQKHNVGLVGDVECDQCVYEERDGYRSVLNRIVTEPHTRIYLVGIANEALRFFAPNYQPKPELSRSLTVNENGLKKLSVWVCILTLPLLTVLFIASNLIGHAWGAIKEGWENSIA